MKLRSITESKKQKQRFNQILMGVILIGMLFLSVLGYAVLNSGRLNKNEKITYNGITFTRQDAFWTAEIEDFKFIFRYNPFQTAEISSFVNSLENYYGMPLYIQSQENSASAEIYNNLNQFAERIQPACLNKSSMPEEIGFNYTLDCKGDYPVKTCRSNFIIIMESNFTDIIQKDNCVFILAPKQDLVNASDEFLFKVLQID